MAELLTVLSVIFIAAGVFLLVADRLQLPTVPFLILAGLMVGPVIDEGLALDLARYGIAFLVFTFGAGIQFESIRLVLTDSESVAVGQFALIGSLGIGVGFLFGLPLAQAVYLGIATGLSSTIVGRGLLEREIRENLVHGRLAESIHFIQDLIAILIVLVLGAEVVAADPIATALGYGVVLLGAAVLVNRLLFVHLQGLTGESDELMLVAVIALLLIFLGAAELVGLSIVVGAFAAGLAIRRDPAEFLNVRNGLESITDFFVAIFFVTIGALVAVPSRDVIVLAVVLAVMVAIVKPVITIALLLAQGYESRSAMLTGLTLDQVSEFALIIAIEALVLGLLAQGVFEAIILAAAATMITSSLSHRYAEDIHRTFADHGMLASGHAKVDTRSQMSEALTEHVIIVGFGRHGRHLVEYCEAVGQPYLVIENDPALLPRLTDRCPNYVFGDAMERYTWDKARVTHARLIVSTVADPSTSRHVVAVGDRTDVIVRAQDAETAAELLDQGALYVNVPDMLAGRRLVELLEALGNGELTPTELRHRQREALGTEQLDTFRTPADERRAVVSNEQPGRGRNRW